MASDDPTPDIAPLPPTKLLSYLRLCRLPNVFTAMADVTMGYYFTHERLEPLGGWLLLLFSSSCLYTAGMVLNDVFDVEIDRRERPERPLPSGQIDVGWARRLGFALLAVGLACGAAAGFLPSSGAAVSWRPAAMAAAIAVSVLLYNGGLKRTLLGPLGMGLCRFFNVLLGMSLAGIADGPPIGACFAPAELIVATGIGVYIVGVTWFARTEAEASSRVMLLLSTTVMAGGIALLALLPDYLPPRTLLFRAPIMWPALLFLLFVTIVRGALNAVAVPEPGRVQQVVRHAIMSLILFDAAITMAMRGAIPALVVLVLIVPMKLFGRWVYST